MFRGLRARAVRGALIRATAPARVVALLALVAGNAACDAQADRDYPGEPLFTLNGQVVGTTLVPQLEAAMLWQRGAPPMIDFEEIATGAPIQYGREGLGTFTIRLYRPPPDFVRRTLGPEEVSFARANVAAIPEGEVWVGTPSGIDLNHWVIHLAADVQPGTLTAWWLGAPLPAGYHLLDVTSVNLSPEQLEACVQTLAGLGVPDATARSPSFCGCGYSLAPAPAGDLVVLPLGTIAFLEPSPSP